MFGEASFCLPRPPLSCDCFHPVWVYSPVFGIKETQESLSSSVPCFEQTPSGMQRPFISHFWGRCSIPGHSLFSHQSAPDAGRAGDCSLLAVANGPSVLLIVPAALCAPVCLRQIPWSRWLSERVIAFRSFVRLLGGSWTFCFSSFV